MSDKPLPYLALACGLTAAIVTLLFWTNAGYLFHTPLYEHGDPGANSLSVLRAEKFHELYGAYSRWEFHHPGPALFCSSAWGELLFYQALHLTPTGYNAQIMVVVILTASFLAGGISVAARWVRGRVFVPLALLVAALHFTAVVPLYCLFGTWTPFVMPMLFVAMLTAAASVAAGQGQDLPLLVLACGFLVHIHVAQPFFVVPIFTLAYLRLMWVCRRPSILAPLQPVSAWRRYPWAHGFAAVLLAIFVLPILVDVCWGNDSNLARIIAHLRSHRGENHPWLDAINCFLRFGSYAPSHSQIAISLGNVVWPQIGNYLVGHTKMMLIWAGASLSPLAALAVRRWSASRPSPERTLATDAGPGRWRYLGWLAFFCALAAGLTLKWIQVEDGEMFYFNSWFVYAIYYVLALIAAASLSDIVESAAARWKRLAWGPTVAAVLCLLGTAGVLFANRALYRDTEYADTAAQAQARTVIGALAARRDAPRGKLLVFPHEAWGAATGVAVLLTRLGYPAFVDPDWHIMFGEDHSSAKLLDQVASEAGHGAPLDIWRLVPLIKTSPAERASAPLVDGYVLQAGLRELDPVGPDAEIRFLGPKANADAYVLMGWAEAGPGAEYTLSVGKLGLIAFRPGPVPPAASVEVSLVFTSPWLWPPVRESQRLTVRFNGHELATTRVAADTPLPLKVSIPAAIWNERPTAMLEMDFPDAISPVELKNGSDDPREFAFCTDRFTFRVAGQEAAPEPTPKVFTPAAP